MLSAVYTTFMTTEYSLLVCLVHETLVSRKSNGLMRLVEF